MIPIVWHSGKGKTMRIIKRSVVAGGLRGGEHRGDEYRKYRGFSGQWKYSVWHYNDGYMSHICPYP